jgi:O-antigen/teichoic acid export membrane protein
MILSKFDFYRFDIQAVVIIISVVCLCLGINKYIQKDTPDEKKNNETLIFVGGILIGFLISLIVSYATLEPDNLDTSDYYN